MRFFLFLAWFPLNLHSQGGSGHGVSISFDVTGVSTSNFPWVQSSFIQGLSDAIDIPASAIDLIYGDGGSNVDAIVNTPSPRDAISLTNHISQIHQDTIIQSIETSLAEDNHLEVDVISMSAPQVHSKATCEFIENTEFYGVSLDRDDLQTDPTGKKFKFAADWTACCAECIGDCFAWSYTPGGNSCFLFSSIIGTWTVSGDRSGIGENYRTCEHYTTCCGSANYDSQGFNVEPSGKWLHWQAYPSSQYCTLPFGTSDVSIQTTCDSCFDMGCPPFLPGKQCQAFDALYIDEAHFGSRDCTDARCNSVGQCDCSDKDYGDYGNEWESLRDACELRSECTISVPNRLTLQSIQRCCNPQQQQYSLRFTCNGESISLAFDAAQLASGPISLRLTCPNTSVTSAPTLIPTLSPTASPTKVPTKIPTDVPSETPTKVPTKIPTTVSTEDSSAATTKVSTASPTTEPTDTSVPPNLPPAVIDEIIDQAEEEFDQANEESSSSGYASSDSDEGLGLVTIVFICIFVPLFLGLVVFVLYVLPKARTKQIEAEMKEYEIEENAKL